MSVSGSNSVLTGLARKNCMKKITLALVCISLLLGAALLEGQLHPLRHWLDDVLYDNWNHYLPCAQLPSVEAVEDVLQKHPETVHLIEAVNPGLVGVEMGGNKCPGKADLLIWYASHHDRLEIERILGESSFFGVPIRLANR